MYRYTHMTVPFIITGAGQTLINFTLTVGTMVASNAGTAIASMTIIYALSTILAWVKPDTRK